ncbi:MAG: hypothetical protein KJO35_07465 [Gammaproteobacteria bacterium]|nr:hypothetical protein [Gammaproteobacteria bacterium]NNF66951.1 hypothetical protein [Gammaproteobacteria bacterium]
MDMMLKILLLTHVVFGFVGLLAFWVPLLTRKGGAVHRRFGRIYKICAYVVLASAGVAVIGRLIQYLLAGYTPATEPRAFAFIIFLGYLALVTFVVVRHGVKVLEYKSNPQQLGTPLTKLLAVSSIVASIIVIAYGIILSPPNKTILFALSPVGILTGSGILRYISNPPATSRGWLYEHLGSMIGGGIAFHTAFTVFGINRIVDLDLSGWVAVVPWIAPAVLGIPATIIWTRHYRRKFGELG